MNEWYSPLWQERARSPATVFTLWSPVLAKRRQISPGSSLGVKSPDPTQLVIAEGARCPGSNLPSGSSGHPEARGQVPQTASCTDCWGNEVTEAVMGEFITTSKPEPRQWVALARALEPCKTQPPTCFLGSPSLPTSPRLGELKALWEKARVHLLPDSPPLVRSEDHHSPGY